YSPARVERLLKDPGIVRNRLKVEGAVKSARAFLETAEEHDGFDPYIWQFVGGKPKRNAWKTLGELPPETEESRAMSKDLRSRRQGRRRRGRGAGPWGAGGPRSPVQRSAARSGRRRAW